MHDLESFSKAFSDRLFHVPDYQRGFAWGEQQWQDFVEDLELLPRDKQHFMRTLILHSGSDSGPVFDDQGKPYRNCDIVDGQ